METGNPPFYLRLNPRASLIPSMFCIISASPMPSVGGIGFRNSLSSLSNLSSSEAGWAWMFSSAGLLTRSFIVVVVLRG